MRCPALLALTILICVVPLLISLGRPGPQHNMEGLALLSAQETWTRQRQGEADAWLIPTQNGEIRVRKPPMLVWIDMLAWSELDPRTSHWHEIIWRARLVTVTLSVVMMLATFWIGRTLGQTPTSGNEPIQESASCFAMGDHNALGLLATMIMGSMLLVQQQARMASYDMHLAAWATLSVAAAIWALQTQRWSGWLLAAIALSLSWMSKGPLALFLFCGPVATHVLLFSRRRMSHILAIIGCLALAAALVSPWYAYLFLQKPTAWKTTWNEIGAQLTNHQPIYFYPLELLKLALPWTLWVLVGLAQPLITKNVAARRRQLVPWIWFMTLLIGFSISRGKASRYILPIAPAMALMAALVWHEHASMAARGLRDSGAKLVAGLHWAVLLLVSIFLGPFLAMQQLLADSKFLNGIVGGVLGSQEAIWLTLALVTVAVAGLAAQWRGRLVYSAMITCIWMSIASAVYWHLEARSSKRMDLYEAAAADVTSAVGEAPLGYLRSKYEDQPDYSFLFFLRRIVEPVKSNRLDDFAGSSGQAFVIAESTGENTARMREAEYQPLFDFQDSSEHHRTLWRAGNR